MGNPFFPVKRERRQEIERCMAQSKRILNSQEEIETDESGGDFTSVGYGDHWSVQ